MTDHPIHDLDDDVHQRVRLGILAALIGLTRADFAHLKRELALTDGNLGRHLDVLGSAGLREAHPRGHGRPTASPAGGDPFRVPSGARSEGPSERHHAAGPGSA